LEGGSVIDPIFWSFRYVCKNAYLTAPATKVLLAQC
jgi:hypothetical protein